VAGALQKIGRRLFGMKRNTVLVQSLVNLAHSSRFGAWDPVRRRSTRMLYEDFEAAKKFARLAVRPRLGGGSRSLGRDAFCSGNISSRTILSSFL
jgi:hypothetical protein